MGIQVEADKLIDKLIELSNLDLSPVISKCCLIVERDAKENCPVASGELRRSIESRVEGNDGEVGTSLFYAPYVEYGTGLFSSQGNGRKDVPWFYQDAKGNWHSTCGNHPHPFLIPAYENNKDRIRKEILDYIKGKVK